MKGCSKGGDRIKNEEFEKLVIEYGNALARLCFSLCRNEFDASDLYQETWMKAYTAYSSDTVKNFEKWLYAVCVNLFRDTYRKKKRSPSEVIFETNEHKDAFMASVPDEREYDAKDYTLLYQAIEKLPDKLRCVISLRYFSDLSCVEISDILGISVSSVTTRLSRAIKKLSTEMNARKENVE